MKAHRWSFKDKLQKQEEYRKAAEASILSKEAEIISLRRHVESLNVLIERLMTVERSVMPGGPAAEELSQRLVLPETAFGQTALESQGYIITSAAALLEVYHTAYEEMMRGLDTTLPDMPVPATSAELQEKDITNPYTISAAVEYAELETSHDVLSAFGIPQGPFVRARKAKGKARIEGSSERQPPAGESETRPSRPFV
jgi:hypothetical protein